MKNIATIKDKVNEQVVKTEKIDRQTICGYNIHGEKIYQKDTVYGHEYWWYYYDGGTITLSEDPKGFTVKEFDKNGNMVSHKMSSGYEELIEYDDHGNRIHKKDSIGYESWWEYDEHDRCVHYKTSTGYEIWYEYDSTKNRVLAKDSNGNEVWFDN